MEYTCLVCVCLSVCLQNLVNSNMLSDQIVVLAGKIEEVELPEMVDIIISEPMGYMLFNERMLETYLHAKKWLKPGGIFFVKIRRFSVDFVSSVLFR